MEKKLKHPVRDLSIPIEKGSILTTERIEKQREKVEKTLQFFSAYPDLYLDLISPVGEGMTLFFFQRLYLRACLRCSTVYIVAGRGTSKTFLAILAMFLRCIFQPRTKQFICAPGKGQGIKIAREKLDEILNKYPLLEKEVFKSNKSGADVHFWFRNGSEFTIVAALDSERGGRRNGGLIDEVRDHDGEDLNQIVIPLMTQDRRLPNGEINPNEIQHAQIYSTSASSKSTYAYEKLMETLIDAAVAPEDNFVLALDVRIPILHNLVSARLIKKQRLSGTYKEGDFAREFLGLWTGGNRDSWFNYSRLSKYRSVVNAENYAKDFKGGISGFYILSVDVGRLLDLTVVNVYKVLTSNANGWQTRLVNIFTYSKLHFEEQSIAIKDLIERFNPREIIIDGSGNGVGLLDFIIKDNVSKDGRFYPAYGSFNDKDLIKKQPPEARRIFNVIKPNDQENAEIHTAAFSLIMSGRVRFLIKEQEAKSKMLKTKRGRKMSSYEKIKFLVPYEETTMLFDETCNLKVKMGRYLGLERINSGMRKDRFSAMEYGLWRIKNLEDEENRSKTKKKKNVKDMINFTRR